MENTADNDESALFLPCTEVFTHSVNVIMIIEMENTRSIPMYKSCETMV